MCVVFLVFVGFTSACGVNTLVCNWRMRVVVETTSLARYISPFERRSVHPGKLLKQVFLVDQARGGIAIFSGQHDAAEDWNCNCWRQTCICWIYDLHDLHDSHQWSSTRAACAYVCCDLPSRYSSTTIYQSRTTIYSIVRRGVST